MIEGEAVVLRPIARGVALEGLQPAGVVFAEGYPSQFSLEVMDILAGPRAATDALRALIALLRVQPGVARITAQTVVEHGASRRVTEKAGMRCCDERLGEVDGKLAEIVIYEVVESMR